MICTSSPSAMTFLELPRSYIESQIITFENSKNQSQPVLVAEKSSLLRLLTRCTPIPKLITDPCVTGEVS